MLKMLLKLELLKLRSHNIGPVYETMRKCNLTEQNENHFFAMFPTVADAVHFARSHNEVPPTPAWSTQVYDENCISRL